MSGPDVGAAPVISPDSPLHVLFASAAKHAMDDALRAQRSARRAPDYWLAEHESARAERLRLGAWDHLRAARVARERANA